jgi:transposase InsO family protein
MPPALIAEDLDEIEQLHIGFAVTLEVLTELALHRREEALHHCVVVAVPTTTHAACESSDFKGALIVLARVRAALIGVVQKASFGATALQGHLERLERQVPIVHGAQRVANELRMKNVNVSPSGVRGVWLRHDLGTRHKRLLRLEKQSQEDTIILTDEQIALLERHSVDFRCRHIESSRPGELLNQDTFFRGSLKGVGKVYVQVVVDVFCSLAFAKVYTSKMPVTACDLLYDRVFPFYEMLGVPIGAVLTDNGREFCGKPETHPYELLVAMEGIEHRTTRVRSPRTNGFVERMNRTLLDECFRVAGRTTWYVEVEEIQRDLDRFLAYYNVERTHQGYRLKGRTPVQALCEALGLDAPPEFPQVGTGSDTINGNEEHAA